MLTRAARFAPAFDAAHELGHLILHRHLQDRQIKNLSLHGILENQAHRFAGALLLPERSFSQEVWAPTLDAFVSLKKHWRCAVAMMVSRCEHLGMLDEVQVKRAWINLSRRGWRTEEPLDNVLEPEEPKLLRRSFQLLIDEGIMRGNNAGVAAEPLRYRRTSRNAKGISERDHGLAAAHGPTPTG